MIALWMTVVMVVDDNGVMVDLINVDPNINNEKVE